MHNGHRAIAYLRVSVVGNRAAEGKLGSPDLQRRAIDEWCGTRGVDVVEEFRDLNRSGGTLTRPGLLAARESLRRGVATGIVVAQSDRASRRVLHTLGLIEQLESDGHWIAAADGTLDTSTPEAKMATIITLAMNERTLDNFRKQSAVVHKRAIMEKGRQMGPAPFGYTRDDDGRLTIDNTQAPFVRLVFERRAEGAGWVHLSRELDDAGVRQRDGSRLNPHLLRRMIKRRVYVGEAGHGEHVQAGAHPAIVDEALWAAANRSAPAVRSTPRTARTHPESLLRGLLRCAGCRYVLKRHSTRKGAHPWWACRTLLTERSATHECESPVRVRQLESPEVERVVVAEFMRLAAGVAAERVPDTTGADAARRLAEAEALLDELSSLDVRRDMGAARWGRMLTEARGEVDRAGQDLATARAVSRVGGTVDTATLEEAWAGMTLAERQEALRSIVQAVMVDAGPGPVAERVHVIPVWESVDLPRKGAHGFVARPFVPGQD